MSPSWGFPLQPGEKCTFTKQNRIILYQDENGSTKVSVRFSDEDLWLTEIQIAEIYDTSRQNINRHIANIYKDGELTENSTRKKYLRVQTEGKRDVERNGEHYDQSIHQFRGTAIENCNTYVIMRQNPADSVGTTTVTARSTSDPSKTAPFSVRVLPVAIAYGIPEVSLDKETVALDTLASTVLTASVTKGGAVLSSVAIS
ncbi:hypothetical protein [Parasphaerochaeta coccoides]|uniref:hypothetical protein n=1 Tax=Parasphaerochaeta coccoides TaxID=273376 RepID=UPI00059ED6ED|nr:hypothetical protein [Parasphaerochaeta coccoides]